MNIYSQKQRWKYLLAIVALLIVIGTIWYTSHIANKVQKEERQKIKLWSQAIRKKAALVKLTNQSFSALAEKVVRNRYNKAAVTKKVKGECSTLDAIRVCRIISTNPVTEISDVSFRVICHTLPIPGRA